VHPAVQRALVPTSISLLKSPARGFYLYNKTCVSYFEHCSAPQPSEKIWLLLIGGRSAGNKTNWWGQVCIMNHEGLKQSTEQVTDYCLIRLPSWSHTWRCNKQCLLTLVLPIDCTGARFNLFSFFRRDSRHNVS
jgi:hypothetical protein